MVRNDKTGKRAVVAAYLVRVWESELVFRLDEGLFLSASIQDDARLGYKVVDRTAF